MPFLRPRRGQGGRRLRGGSDGRLLLTEEGLAAMVELQARKAEWADAGISSVTRTGDCLAPGLIAAAVYSGHQYARPYLEPANRDRVPFRREDIARLY